MKNKVFVAIACERLLLVEFVQSIIDLLQHLPCPLELSFHQGEGFVGRARNSQTTDFLYGDCSHILFLDSDMQFKPAHIKQLIDHNLPIVGGFYAKKQAELHWVCNPLPEKPEADENGLLQVKYIGTGFLLVQRKVIEKMIGKGPATGYQPENKGRQEWEFFPIGVRPGEDRYLSEDWWFCQNALDIGYKIYGDTKCVLGHIG